jgi:hypothetical protein
LKKNRASIPNALDKVMSMRGVTFDWKDTTKYLGFEPEHQHDVGVIAQEIQSVLPEAVRFAPFDVNQDGTSKSGENYLTVQYEKLTALLIEAVKEQQHTITTHEIRLASLEKQLSMLMGKI